MPGEAFGEALDGGAPFDSGPGFHKHSPMEIEKMSLDILGEIGAHFEDDADLRALCMTCKHLWALFEPAHKRCASKYVKYSIQIYYKSSGESVASILISSPEICFAEIIISGGGASYTDPKSIVVNNRHLLGAQDYLRSFGTKLEIIDKSCYVSDVIDIESWETPKIESKVNEDFIHKCRQVIKKIYVLRDLLGPVFDFILTRAGQ